MPQNVLDVLTTLLNTLILLILYQLLSVPKLLPTVKYMTKLLDTMLKHVKNVMLDGKLKTMI